MINIINHPLIYRNLGGGGRLITKLVLSQSVSAAKMKLPKTDADNHLHGRLMDVPLIEKGTFHMDHIIREDLFFYLNWFV